MRAHGPVECVGERPRLRRANLHHAVGLGGEIAHLYAITINHHQVGKAHAGQGLRYIATQRARATDRDMRIARRSQWPGALLMKEWYVGVKSMTTHSGSPSL